MIQSENKIQSLPVFPALLNELLLHHRQAIVLLNAEGVIIFCTETVKLIAGFEREELVGCTAFDFFDPADAGFEEHKDRYRKTAISNSFASLVPIRNKSGDIIWIDLLVKNLLHVTGINAIFVLLKNSCNAAIEERKLLQAMTAAKEEERAFIAGELHDNVNQIITATKLLVDRAIMNNDHKEELLKLSSANLQLVIDEIRSLSHCMESCQLHKHGLAFAIAAFIANIRKASPLRLETKLQTSVALVLTADQQLQVYRIIQEAINNILRHAAATLAEIILATQDQSIYLVIKDNGKGFSMNRIKPGMGLSSISNRVKILRGHFSVRSQKGQGTTIEIHFPL
jgi:PAS domain S-box-containing protein